MVTLIYSKDLSPDPKKFVNIRVNSIGDWLPSNATSTELQQFDRQKTKPDGNCLFQALASAAVMRKVTHQSDIDKVRSSLVEALSQDMQTWSAEKLKAFDLTVGALYYPPKQTGVKRTLWRVYLRAEMKKLKKKRQQKTVVYTMQADAQVMFTAGTPVKSSASYLEYLACTGRQRDKRQLVSFSYNEAGVVVAIDEDFSLAAYGGEIILRYVPVAMNAVLWVYSVGKDEKDALYKYEPRTVCASTNAMYIHLEGLHYE